MRDITNEVRKAELRRKLEEKTQAVKVWWDDNKQIIVPLIPLGLTVFGAGIKVAGKHHNLKLEERNKDRRCYDASLGHYWELSRKLSNREWVEIESRRKNGERLGDILSDMRVLK